MGDWRKVHIEGTCGDGDVPALRTALDPGRDYENFHCLVCGGVSGLPNWAAEKIYTTGNLAERNYDEHSVAEQLVKLVKVAPSLRIKIYVGGENESDECVATVVLDDDGVRVCKPQMETLPPIKREQMATNLFNQMFRPPW
jgi:hypothetical protein